MKTRSFVRTLVALLLVFSLITLVACDTKVPPADKTYRVMVVTSEGCSVVGDATQEVAEGGNAVFNLSFEENYLFTDATAGVFDEEAGTLTVENVTKAMTVTVTADKVDYDTNKTVRVQFSGSTGDSMTPAPGDVKLGTLITLKAGDTTRVFGGWIVDAKGTTPVSHEKEYQFRLTPDYITKKGSLEYVKISSKYTDANVYYYDANGGTVNTESVNAKGNANRTVDRSGAKNGTLKVTMSKEYLDYVSCVNAFWDDGTFTREGYVLKEYNTKPDGTGEPYSPGDLVYQVNDDGSKFTLYCIWEKTAPDTDFTYETIDISESELYPAPKFGVWKTSGVRITSYKGNAKSVAVPETIGGKPVISIAKDAFKDKLMTSLTLPRTLQIIEDGAFVNCSSLTTLYYPAAVYHVSDAAMDAATMKNLSHFIVRMTTASRSANVEYGAYAVKMSRVLESKDQKRIIFVAGSSILQGLSTPYLEKLLDNEYQVVNFGTMRTTHGAMIFEAMQHYTDKDDIVVYAPENSSYMMGETELYGKTLYCMAAYQNCYRYIDMTHYTKVFSAFANMWREGSMSMERPMLDYEAILTNTALNKYGDYLNDAKGYYCGQYKYYDAYFITLNKMMKSRNEGNWSDVNNQVANRDYTDPANVTWADITDPYYKDQINYCIDKVKATGAKVVFGFCPMDASKVVEEARNKEWIAAYDKLFLDNFGFDGLLGKSSTYLYAHEYFYDCAFHTNYYGVVYHSYNLYRDLCALTGKQVKYKIGSFGDQFTVTIFEKDGGKIRETPLYTTEWVKKLFG